MRGYCESCAEVVNSVDEAHGAEVCPNCGDDVHPGVHVEELYAEDEAQPDFDFDQWLLKE